MRRNLLRIRRSQHLGNKCFRIYILDQTENRTGFTFLCQNKHHLDIVLGITANAVDKRHTTVKVFVDAVSYFFIFIGNDEELYGLAGTVDDLIQHKT